MRILFSFSILALIWSIYYLAMHITGGILTTPDTVVCGTVIIACISIIIWNVVWWIKSKRTDGNTEDNHV